MNGPPRAVVIAGMKLLRCALAISCAALLAACSDNHAAAPTPARLSATVTPNPMAAPTEGGSDLLFNLELRAGRSGTVSLQEGDAQLLDASGALVGRTKNFWSQESGCAISLRKSDWMLEARLRIADIAFATSAVANPPDSSTRCRSWTTTAPAQSRLKCRSGSRRREQ